MDAKPHQELRNEIEEAADVLAAMWPDDLRVRAYAERHAQALRGLIEQYGTLERHLDELARAAEKFWHEVEHNEFVHFGEFERAIDRARRAQTSFPGDRHGDSA